MAIAGCTTEEPDDSPEAVTQPAGNASPVPKDNPYAAESATARISGSIVFDGTPPEMPFIEMTSDFCCTRNATGTRSEEVLVTDGGLLPNVIVYVRRGHDEELFYLVPADPVRLDQQRCVYAPRALTIMTQQELIVRNSDRTLHNVPSQSQANTAFNFAQASQEMETSERFAVPEMPVMIGCDLHRWMRTFVGVFDHPFHTTSADTDTFELTLPPSTYEIVAWHELYGKQSSTVEVAENESVELNFTFSE